MFIQREQVLKMDFSCIHRDTTFDRAANSGAPRIPETVARFADMVLMKLTSGAEDASDECFAIGQPTNENVSRVSQLLVLHLQMAHAAHGHAPTGLPIHEIRTYAVRMWMASHHRN